MINSCYIHIPFCKNICSYCDFCKNYYDENVVYSYFGSLKNEVLKNYSGDLIKTLYVGGGTPSVLNEKELDMLFEIINLLKIDDNCEFTFECNYENINISLLKKLKKNKVNRLSIGIQTFNKRFEDILQRKINKDDMILKISLAKKYFDNINVDLMYALPTETLDELKSDLNTLISLNVNHVSSYALILEEHTKLWINKTEEVSDDIQRKMYDLICDTLIKNGYIHYELSNFSYPGYESKHNLTYWSNNEYYGFGVGASGFVNKVRYDNTKSIAKYINGNYTMCTQKTELKQMIMDEVMLGLRKTLGINKEMFNKKYDILFEDAFDISSLKKDGILIEDSEKIYIPNKYLFVSNEIILKIMENCLLN